MSKRGNGDATYRKRRDGRWEGRLMVGYKADGLIDQRSRYGSTLKEVQNKIKILMSQLDYGISLDGDSMKFGVWINQAYEIYKKPTIKPVTQTLYESTITKHITGSSIDKPLSELKPHMIQRFLNHKAKSYSYESVNRMKILIGWALKKAIHERILLINPFDGVEIPKCSEANKRESKHLPLDELIKLKNYLINEESNLKIRAVVLTALYTGMRIGEICALYIDDVDFDTNTININKSVRGLNGAFVIGTPKTKNGIRKIPLPADLVKPLKLWIIERNKLKLMWHDIWPEEEFLFCSDSGKPLNRANALKSYKRLLTRAGVGDYTLHELRHTYATRLRELGVDPSTAAQMLGHDVVTMLKTYAKVEEKYKIEVANKLNDLLK